MDTSTSRDRRMVLGGLTSAVVASFPVAGSAQRSRRQPEPEPARYFERGPLARNQLATGFRHPPEGLTLPSNAKLMGRNRTRTSFEAFRGKTLIVNLWAEWCLPCMVELQGLAIMAKRANSSTFEIVPILTSSNAFSTPEQALRILSKIGAEDLPTLVDGTGSGLTARLARRTKNDSGALPCTLLVDPAGVIRARYIGSSNVKVNGEEYSVWSTTIADQFVKALAAGALDSQT